MNYKDCLLLSGKYIDENYVRHYDDSKVNITVLVSNLVPSILVNILGNDYVCGPLVMMFKELLNKYKFK